MCYIICMFPMAYSLVGTCHIKRNKTYLCCHVSHRLGYSYFDMCHIGWVTPYWNVYPFVWHVSLWMCYPIRWHVSYRMATLVHKFIQYFRVLVSSSVYFIFLLCLWLWIAFPFSLFFIFLHSYPFLLKSKTAFVAIAAIK